MIMLVQASWHLQTLHKRTSRINTRIKFHTNKRKSTILPALPKTIFFFIVTYWVASAAKSCPNVGVIETGEINDDYLLMPKELTLPTLFYRHEPASKLPV